MSPNETLFSMARHRAAEIEALEKRQAKARIFAMELRRKEMTAQVKNKVPDFCFGIDVLECTYFVVSSRKLHVRSLGKNTKRSNENRQSLSDFSNSKTMRKVGE